MGNDKGKVKSCRFKSQHKQQLVNLISTRQQRTYFTLSFVLVAA